MSEGLSVLIIEDDDDARAALRDLLSLDDHVVTTAASAEDAFQSRDWSALDVVLLDRRLPDGTAEALLPRLKQAAPHLDVIVVTGFADMESTVAALREGAADYIIKPVNPDVLRESLQRIANRRRIERELQEERNFAATLLDTAEAIVLVLDTAGRIVRFNPYLTELTGFQLEHVRGLDWFETFVPPAQRSGLQGVFDRTVRQLQTRGVLNSILTKDGRTCDIRWSNTALRDAEGETMAVLSVGLDVTDLGRAQKQLLQAERLATIGQTMTGLAHESRGALQRIQAAVELLELRHEDDEESLRNIRKIEQATADMRELLEEVRSYAAPIHLERGNTSSLSAIWRRAWHHVAESHAARRPRLVEHCCESPSAHRLDDRRFEQVFRNLFENAVDACQGAVEVTVTCEESAERTRVVVRDNGPGINHREKHRVFEPFYTTKPTGTGLGLAIVKRIVEAHGGVVDVDDGPQPGTAFVIELPHH